MKFLILFFLISTEAGLLLGQDLYRTNNGQISFVSDAPLELISAQSDNCQGILSLPEGAFVFRVFIKTFEGFNNPIQKEHFYENYMEVSQYPEALFQGYVLEKVQFDESSSITVRAKGDLQIHGIVKEKIIDVRIEKSNENNLSYHSTFEIFLEEFNIDVPNIVKQKIAEKIKVTVKGKLDKSAL